MVDTYRTPEHAFSDLPGFAFQPQYRDIDGMRVAFVDEGDGPAVVFFHGEPTWSFLWRKVIPPIRDAGYRCIAPDYPGFGRSDKPTDIEWYTYDRHVAVMAALLEDLDIGGATAVVHDWGGPIGLRLAVEHPHRFDRIVMMETGLFTGEMAMTDDWLRFRDFVARTPDPPVGKMVRNACYTRLGDDVVAAYDAPFGPPESKAGVRAFPAILPLTPDAPGAAEGRAVAAALAADERPGLVIWAEEDPILPLEMGRAVAAGLGYPPPVVIPAASHFLQEDAGADIGALIAEWLDTAESVS